MTPDRLSELEHMGDDKYPGQWDASEVVRELVAEIRRLHNDVHTEITREGEFQDVFAENTRLKAQVERMFEREALADERHSILLWEARAKCTTLVDKAIALTRSMDEGDGLVDVDRLVRALEDLK